jgi:hypothetical protein
MNIAEMMRALLANTTRLGIHPMLLLLSALKSIGTERKPLADQWKTIPTGWRNCNG